MLVQTAFTSLLAAVIGPPPAPFDEPLRARRLAPDKIARGEHTRPPLWSAALIAFLAQGQFNNQASVPKVANHARYLFGLRPLFGTPERE